MAVSDKLTVLDVKNAKPKAKPYKLADGGGLYLEVMPNGSRYWRMKYRFAGKEGRLALGVFPEVSLKDARQKKIKARQQLSAGLDPSNERRQLKFAAIASRNNTFGSIAEEWLEKQGKNWSVSHTTRTKWLLQNHLLPWLGKRPVQEITTPELLAVLRRIEHKGIHETAHRAKQTAGQIFRYAIATGRSERDPTPALKGALTSPKEVHLASITRPDEVGHLLLAMDGYRGTPEVKAALLLSPLLFQRPGEIRTMKWEDIDFEKAEWRFTVSKTNTPHIVPLCRQAVEILKDLQPITGKSAFVFPSARGGSRPLSENGVRTALRTLGYSNEQITPHGFRAMARTLLDEELGYRVDWIEHQLAHAVKDPNGRAYNRTAHLEGRKEMMQGWADYLDKLKAESAPTDIRNIGYTPARVI